VTLLGVVSGVLHRFWGENWLSEVILGISPDPKKIQVSLINAMV
jgi:hypothetical protein